MQDSPDKSVDLATAIASKASRELSAGAKAALAPAVPAGAARPRLAEVIERVDTLRTFERDHPGDPAELLRRVGTMGARRPGMAEFNNLGSNLKPDTAGAVPPPIIYELQRFTLYAEVLQRQRETGETINHIVNDPAFRQEFNQLGTNWQTLENGVSDRLLRMEAVRAVMPPELYALGLADQREIIQTLVSTDPRFREAVIEGMKGVVTQAESIPKPSLPTQEQTNLEAERDAHNAKITAIRDGLRRLGLADGQIDAYMDGRSAPQALRAFEADLLVQGGIPLVNQGEVPTFVTEVAAKKEARRISDEKQRGIVELEGIQVVQVARGRALTAEQDAKLLRLQGEKTAADADINTIQGKINAIAQRIGKTEGEIEATIESAKKTVYGGQGVLGVPEQGLKATLEELVREADEKRRVEFKLAHPPALSQEKQAERIAKQAELTVSLENVMAEALSKVLLQRYEDAKALNGRKVEADARVAEKEGKDTLAKGIRAIGKAIDGNWLAYDEANKRRVAHRDTILHDLGFLAGQGEDRLKRLMVRDLIAAHLISQEPDPANLANLRDRQYGDLDFDQLPEKDKKLLDAVYDQESARYRDRLFADYFATRQAREQLGIGPRLTNDQLLELSRKFGAAFEGKITAYQTRGTAEIARQFRRGIAINPFAFLMGIWAAMSEIPNQTPTQAGG